MGEKGIQDHGNATSGNKKSLLPVTPPLANDSEASITAVIIHSHNIALSSSATRDPAVSVAAFGAAAKASNVPPSLQRLVYEFVPTQFANWQAFSIEA